MRKKIIIIYLLAVLIMPVFSGCGKKEDVKEEKILNTVKTIKAKQAKSIKQSLEYPGIVVSEQEAKLVAKTSGNAEGVKFNVGDKVSIGQILFKIDDVNSGSQSNQGFDANQIKQATLAVKQAEDSYSLAQKNYNSLLLSSEKDLKLAELSKNQSGTGKDNLNLTTVEAVKSAELALETAEIAKEQAKINLDNRKNLSNQSNVDTITNADTTVDSVANTCGTIIVAINNIANLDDSIEILYEKNLGVLNTKTLLIAKEDYLKANEAYKQYLNSSPDTTQKKIEIVSKLAESTKKLADSSKQLFDKSITSDVLSQASLSGLQTTVAGYQSQINLGLTQINGAKQSLTNTKLNNDTTLDSLTKAYELAVKQEESAKQNLENLKAGNKSQADQASFAYNSANNQYENAKIKIDSQISVSKSQLSIAETSYRNALVSLQSLYDIHQIISPIDGFIVKKMVSNGDTVSAGQVLAIISQSNKIKLQIYVNQEDLVYLKLAQTVEISDSNNKKISGIITSISQQADDTTKRFLVEISPKDENEKFSLGTVINVKIEYEKNIKSEKNLILSLSAIEIGQNDNYVKIIENGKVKKISIKIVKIDGEFVEINTDLNSEIDIIIEGNKMVEEGEEVKIVN